MKLLLVDDHRILLEGLDLLVRMYFQDVDTLMAGTLSEARAALARHPDIHLVLLDLGLPDADDLQALVELRHANDAVAITVLSADASPARVLAAIDAGAAGFIHKSTNAAEMIAALRHVLAGGVHLPSAVLAVPKAAAAAQPGSLSQRQRDVLRLLIQGKPNKLICRELGLSESTVKTHLAIIFERLGVHSRTQAVVAAARLGWRFDLGSAA